jgi:SAM-dependent methyltransferase
MRQWHRVAAAALRRVSAARVARRWSRVHGGTEAFPGEVYWLAVPEVQRRFMAKTTCGRADHWAAYCVSEFLGDRLPVDRMLSVGCGTGALERRLASLGAFRTCDAFDVAPGALALAREEAERAGLTGIRYEVGDVQDSSLPERAYDAVWFNDSLHHVRDLERVCEAVARSLRQDGFLFFCEYVGPSRFAFPPRQREALDAAFRLIPPRYRRSLAPGRAGQLKRSVTIPNPVRVALADPSEAVRSAEILPVVSRYFEVVRRNDAGGSLLQYLLHEIAGHFRADDPQALAVLRLLFDVEDTLLEVGDLQSDFALVVARPRDTAVPPARV